MNTRFKRNLAFFLSLFCISVTAVIVPLYGQEKIPQESWSGDFLKFLRMLLIPLFIIGPIVSGLLQKNETVSAEDGEHFQPCPKCSGTRIRKLTFGKWEGKFGPKLFHLVWCENCNSTYNGKSGSFSYLSRVISMVVVYAVAFSMLYYIISI